MWKRKEVVFWVPRNPRLIGLRVLSFASKIPCVLSFLLQFKGKLDKNLIIYHVSDFHHIYFMKKRLLTILFSWAISLSYGQSFQVKDLAKSVGFWEGELTYLDYSGGQLLARRPNEMHRIAKIKVDPKQLDLYKSLLNEQMLAAIKLEPGVLSYTVVADKKDASSMTIFEVYANQEAYQSHILTAHFKKYKEAVKDMVLSLELIDVDLIINTKKENMYQI